MNALQLINTGPAESCLQYTQVPTPTITRKDDIIVRIKATGVNPVEAKFRAGNMGYYPLSLPCIFGSDYAGIVAAVGSNVTDFKVGDAVYGSLQYAFASAGTYAEYTIVSPTKDAIVKKPDAISFEEAAATGIAGVYMHTRHLGSISFFILTCCSQYCLSGNHCRWQSSQNRS